MRKYIGHTYGLGAGHLNIRFHCPECNSDNCHMDISRREAQILITCFDCGHRDRHLMAFAETVSLGVDMDSQGRPINK